MRRYTDGNRIYKYHDMREIWSLMGLIDSVHRDEDLQEQYDDDDRNCSDDDALGCDLKGLVGVLGIKVSHESRGLGESSAFVLLCHDAQIL